LGRPAFLGDGFEITSGKPILLLSALADKNCLTGSPYFGFNLIMGLGTSVVPVSRRPLQGLGGMPAIITLAGPKSESFSGLVYRDSKGQQAANTSRAAPVSGRWEGRPSLYPSDAIGLAAPTYWNPQSVGIRVLSGQSILATAPFPLSATQPLKREIGRAQPF